VTGGAGSSSQAFHAASSTPIANQLHDDSRWSDQGSEVLMHLLRALVYDMPEFLFDVCQASL